MSRHLEIIKLVSSPTSLQQLFNETKRAREEKYHNSQVPGGVITPYKYVTAIRADSIFVNMMPVKFARVFVYTEDSQALAEVGWVVACDVNHCMLCATTFGLFNPKHHCRGCGYLVCKGCLNFKGVLVEMRHLKEMRVCRECYGPKGEVILFNNSKLGVSVEIPSDFNNLKLVTQPHARSQREFESKYHNDIKLSSNRMNELESALVSVETRNHHLSKLVTDLHDIQQHGEVDGIPIDEYCDYSSDSSESASTLSSNDSEDRDSTLNGGKIANREEHHSHSSLVDDQSMTSRTTSIEKRKHDLEYQRLQESHRKELDQLQLQIKNLKDTTSLQRTMIEEVMLKLIRYKSNNEVTESKLKVSTENNSILNATAQKYKEMIIQLAGENYSHVEPLLCNLINDLKHQISILKAETTEKNTLMEYNAMDFADLCAKLQLTELESLQSKQQVTNLMEEKDNLNGIIFELQQKNKHFQSELDEKDSHMSSAMMSKEDVSKLKASQADLRNKLKISQNRNNEYNQVIRDRDEIIDSLSDKTNELRMKIEDLSEEKNLHIQEMNNLKSHLKHSEELNEKLRIELDNFVANDKSSENDKLKIVNDLNESLKAYEDIRDQMESLKAIHTELENSQSHLIQSQEIIQNNLNIAHDTLAEASLDIICYELVDEALKTAISDHIIDIKQQHDHAMSKLNEENNTLEGRLNHMKSCMELMDIELNESKQMIEVMQSDLSKAHNTNSSLNQANDELQSKKEELLAIVDNSNKELHKLQEYIHVKTDSMNDDLRKALDDLAEAKLDITCHALVGVAIEDAVSIQSEGIRHRHKEELNNLSNNYWKLLNEINHLKSDFEAAKIDSEACKQQLIITTIELSAKQGLNTSLMLENNSQNIKIEELNTLLESAKQDFDKLKIDTELTKQHLEYQLNNAHDTLAEASLDIICYELVDEALKTAISDYIIDIKLQHDHAMSKLNEENNTLEGRLNHMKSCMELMDIELNESKQMIEVMQSDLSKAHNTNSSLSQANDELQSKKEELNDELDRLQSHIIEIQQEAMIIKEKHAIEMEEKQAVFDQSVEDNREVANQLKMMSQQCDYLSSEIINLESSKHDLEIQLSDVCDTKEIMKRELDSARAQLDELNKCYELDTNSLINKNFELQTQLDHSKINNDVIICKLNECESRAKFSSEELSRVKEQLLDYERSVSEKDSVILDLRLQMAEAIVNRLHRGEISHRHSDSDQISFSNSNNRSYPNVAVFESCSEEDNEYQLSKSTSFVNNLNRHSDSFTINHATVYGSKDEEEIDTSQMNLLSQYKTIEIKTNKTEIQQLKDEIMSLENRYKAEIDNINFHKDKENELLRNEVAELTSKLFEKSAEKSLLSSSNTPVSAMTSMTKKPSAPLIHKTASVRFGRLESIRLSSESDDDV
eukprot:gene4083-5829_t